MGAVFFWEISMATRAAKAEMQDNATRRIDAAVQTLQKRFNLDALPARPLVRDPEFARIQELEDHASVLEGVVKATAPKAAAKVDAEGAVTGALNKSIDEHNAKVAEPKKAGK